MNPMHSRASSLKTSSITVPSLSPSYKDTFVWDQGNYSCVGTVQEKFIMSQTGTSERVSAQNVSGSGITSLGSSFSKLQIPKSTAL